MSASDRPGAAAPADSTAPPALQLALDGSGRVTVDGTPVNTTAELGPHLERARAQGGLVVIEASPQAPEARLMELVAVVRKAGIGRAHLSFIPQAPAAAPAAVSSAAAANGMGTASFSPPPGGAGSLPELALRTVGMHVGGGPNDAPTRAFFRQPLEDRFDDFRRCYPLVEEPGKGGTFGADLLIGKQGGKPQVEQPRSTFGGPRFRACMLEAFAKARFPKPPTGSTKISYSLRFSLGDK